MATKASKTFKIGEYAKGGVITVEVKGNLITVIGKDWDFSTGSRKSSDQSNAQEFERTTIDATSDSAYRRLIERLEDLTTSYYAGEIYKWVATKVNIQKSLFW
jgi:hypothetical protein